MKMTFRWYGPEMDSIPLRYIKQIPGMNGVVSSLMEMQAGADWPEDKIQSLKKQVNDAGLSLEVIESVNVHEDIKLGRSTRDKYIQNYINTIHKLGRIGVKVICYNFMPVFDWTRTDLAYCLPDGSTTMRYQQSVVDQIKDPQQFANEIQKRTQGYEMAGWEPERMAEIKSLLRAYKEVSHQDLFNNLIYFLKAIMPACHEAEIKMAIHPDDPGWDIFGLPRVVNSAEGIRKLLDTVNDPCNCLTFCTGSLGSRADNDLPAIAREFCSRGRIPFAHIRNLKKIDGENDFFESAHVSSCGSFDMFEIVKALYESGFDGYIRPDHGRMIWDEQGRAGYGLYDRALGAVYINGLWEAIEKG